MTGKRSRQRSISYLPGLLLLGVSAGNCLVADDNGTTTFRNVRLSADQVLAGGLTDESGNAIPNEPIELFDRDLSRQATRTDAAGRFAFTHVAPGEYLVIIRNWFVPCHALAHTSARTGSLTMLELTIPEHAHGSGSEEITLASGQASAYVELPVQSTVHSESVAQSYNLLPESDPRLTYWPDDEPSGSEGEPGFTPVQPRAESEELTEEDMVADVAEDEPADEPRFDPALVSRGQAAFQSSCIDCHDANRALDKRKTYAAWLTTVRRMALMDGANVAQGDHTAIATYLASLNPAAASDGLADSGAGVLDGALGLDAAGGFSANATISLLWRTIDDGNTMLSPGFFPDIWLSGTWNPGGMMRAKVVACTSCHSDGGFTFELVEASATLDLMKLYDDIHGTPCDDACEPERTCQLELRAGRFPMPFGGFTGYGHPGSLRTLTNPLIYDMARRVNDFALPVMNMPFSDEGANLSLMIPLDQEWDVTTDVYAMNGRRETGFASQILSRSYRDNNKEPAVGSRVTFGNSDLRLGSSIVWGDAGVGLEYVAYGADLNFRFEDLFRLYMEYAYRTQVVGGPINQMSKGYVTELEFYLIDDPGISLLTRYDTLDSNFAADWEVRRFTWGINTALPGGSTLLVHHEHWDSNQSNGQPDLIGLRWTCAF